MATVRAVLRHSHDMLAARSALFHQGPAVHRSSACQKKKARSRWQPGSRASCRPRHLHDLSFASKVSRTAPDWIFLGGACV
jgi:hypothetical protein